MPDHGGAGSDLARCILLALVALAPAVAWAAPAKEDAARHELRQAEQARAAQLEAKQQAAARAAAAQAEEQRLAAERVAAAAKLRDAEAATEQAALRMDELAVQRQAAQERLNARAAAMQPLLPLIERLSLYPAETLLAVPAAPEDRLRGLLVLQALSRQIEAEAEGLRRDQSALDAATKAVAAESPKLAAARAAQAEQAAALDRMIAAVQARRQQALTEGEAADRRAAEQAAKADSLRGVVATLEKQRSAEQARAREEAAQADRRKKLADAEAARRKEAALARPVGLGSHAQPGGQLTAPVRGTVIRAWGETTDAGPATGVSYYAAPNARVVSPCAGRVVFADSFRTYGLLLIVDCGGGYHAVVAGFDHLDAKVGQTVQAGEPMGVMPGWEPGETARRPSLYVELRRDGQPVNPAPWLKSNS